MKYWIFYVCILLIESIVCLEVVAQNNSDREDIPKELFESSMSKLHHQQLEQGIAYSYFYPSIKGHQYLFRPSYTTGSMTYEGVTYGDILLNYDIYNDLVLTTLVQNGLTVNIIVDRTRIDRFQIGSDNFVHIKEPQGVLLPGIYKLAFDSKQAQLYVRVKKNVVANNQPGMLRKFAARKSLYLTVAGVAYRIDNKRQILEVFSSNQDVAGYIKNNKLKFTTEEQIESSTLNLLEALFSK